MQLNNLCWNTGISGEKSSYLNYIYTCTGVKHGVSFCTAPGKHTAAPALLSRLVTSPAVQQGALQVVWTCGRVFQSAEPVILHSCNEIASDTRCKGISLGRCKCVLFAS